MVRRFLNLTLISLMLSLVLAPMVLNTPVAMAKSRAWSGNRSGGGVVTPVLTSIAVTSSSYTVTVGGTTKFIATPKDQNDNPYVGAVIITFASNNTAVATVGSTTGIVTGISAGSAAITASLIKGSSVLSDNAIITVTGSTPPPTPTPTTALQWGAYVGDGSTAISDFETMVGKKMNILADFESFDVPFPTYLSTNVGQQGKTLLVFWEPSTGFDSITNGSLDSEIKLFAAGAKSYGYPVILAPFDEMNLNETAWGCGINANTPAKFKAAWQHVHDLFAGDTNVKFALDFNNVSIPSGAGNTYADYYPGSAYVDIVGIDGYNFGNPWQSFSQVFSGALAEASQFGKPIYLLALASAPGSAKASWITDGLGTFVKNNPSIKGWVWFNTNKEMDWRVNSDAASLQAFKSILP